jgi:hypothetical protein
VVTNKSDNYNLVTGIVYSKESKHSKHIKSYHFFIKIYDFVSTEYFNVINLHLLNIPILIMNLQIMLTVKTLYLIIQFNIVFFNQTFLIKFYYFINIYI